MGAGRGRIFGGRARGVDEETAPETRRRTGIGRAVGGGPRKATPTTDGGTGSSTLTQLPGPGTRRSARRPQERAPPQTPPPPRLARRSSLYERARGPMSADSIAITRRPIKLVFYLTYDICYQSCFGRNEKKIENYPRKKKLGDEFNSNTFFIRKALIQNLYI